jgi:hypothetical protein
MVIHVMYEITMEHEINVMQTWSCRVSDVKSSLYINNRQFSTSCKLGPAVCLMKVDR